MTSRFAGPPKVERPSDTADHGTISLLSKKNPSAPAAHQQSFQPVEIESPETVLQTDLSPEEFSHALFSSIDLIPDVPYELDDYKPQNPVETPKSYPQVPNMRLLQPEFFRRYDISTLFYIFFYFPGSSQQSFAARELKQRSWRFHTKYQTWFHRLSEPTELTNEYEVGHFEYFDHREPDGWCVRERANFKLEYNHLETE
jgi:CCR4-NOT transcription complex subunit 3